MCHFCAQPEGVLVPPPFLIFTFPFAIENDTFLLLLLWMHTSSSTRAITLLSKSWPPTDPRSRLLTSKVIKMIINQSVKGLEPVEETMCQESEQDSSFSANQVWRKVLWWDEMRGTQSWEQSSRMKFPVPVIIWICTARFRDPSRWDRSHCLGETGRNAWTKMKSEISNERHDSTLQLKENMRMTDTNMNHMLWYQEFDPNSSINNCLSPT